MERRGPRNANGIVSIAFLIFESICFWLLKVGGSGTGCFGLVHSVMITVRTTI